MIDPCCAISFVWIFAMSLLGEYLKWDCGMWYVFWGDVICVLRNEIVVLGTLHAWKEFVQSCLMELNWDDVYMMVCIAKGNVAYVHFEMRKCTSEVMVLSYLMCLNFILIIDSYLCKPYDHAWWINWWYLLINEWPLS